MTMSISLHDLSEAHAPSEREAAERVRVNWVTVVVCASVIAYIDGFWLTSLRGAVGAIEATQSPFSHWLRDSTLMVPPLVLAVLAALLLTRRWIGQNRREAVQLAVAALLIVGIGSAVSIAEVTARAAHDYSIQARQLEVNHTGHTSVVTTQPATANSTSSGTCTGLCAAKHATLMAQVRAVGYASVVLLVTNLVLVAWALAARGGRLWSPPRTDAVLDDDGRHA
jgi:hypothetical protein